VIKHVLITEYFPAPEKWFKGKKIAAAGITGKHRIDWLYSARGLPMEGDGVDLTGRHWHYESSGAGGWVSRNGRGSGATGSYWLNAMYWRNKKGEVTFPLEAGGWSNGPAKKGSGVSAKGTQFGYGLTLPLHYWQSVATDRSVIPRGSAVYLAAFRRKPGGGYMCAQDTGGAIIGNHIDVWRPAPSTPDGGESYTNQTVRVIPPSQARVILPFCR
jgi:3D (Asp-Asp-Asp) domain-containing protein